jgi:hypothetical protein
LLFSETIDPILIAKHSQLEVIGAMVEEPARQKRKSASRPQRPDLTLSTCGEGPDPRLVELVRLLARRAARQWFEEMKTEPGSKGS